MNVVRPKEADDGYPDQQHRKYGMSAIDIIVFFRMFRRKVTETKSLVTKFLLCIGKSR
ncbi:hypothetical protein E4U38_007259 [Claviceps purpurea]|nr:hypothetical protein E4U38_007259 [Claviceps purpurea]KAG6246871.1 hypothetical protein E4U23_004269 [Claviceps purpurea]